MASPEQRLRHVLEAFARDVEGVKSLVVGDPSGLPVASLVRGPKAMATTAMATLLVSAARNVVKSMELSEMRDLLIEGEDWVVFLRYLGEGFTLLGLAGAETNLGLSNIAAVQRAAEIRELLDEIR